jgi:hypothetical protein
LLRAKQERTLGAAPQTGLIDGGLGLDYHGFARLFHVRGLIPLPELIVRLRADQGTVASR